MATWYADNTRITEFEIGILKSEGNNCSHSIPITEDMLYCVNGCIDDFEQYFKENLDGDWALTASMDTLRKWIEDAINSEEDLSPDPLEVEIYTDHGDPDPFYDWTRNSIVTIDDCTGYIIKCHTEVVPFNRINVEKFNTIQDAERSNSMNINRIHELDITPNRIWFNPPYTTVEWVDKTKTTACAENPENFSEYNGFAACVAKRLYGNTTQAIYLMDKALDEATRPKREKEARRAAEKARKREMQEELRKVREYRLKAEVDRERLRRRAVQIVDEEDERRQYE